MKYRIGRLLDRLNERNQSNAALFRRETRPYRTQVLVWADIGRLGQNGQILRFWFTSVSRLSFAFLGLPNRYGGARGGLFRLLRRRAIFSFLSNVSFPGLTVAPPAILDVDILRAHLCNAVSGPFSDLKR